MSKVSTREDIMADVKARLPEIDPKILEDIFDATIDYIHDRADDPNVIQISVGEKLGSLTSNFHMNRFSHSKVSKERVKIMREMEDKMIKCFMIPYLPAIIAKLNKRWDYYKLDYRSYLEMLERASYETNKRNSQ